jgi:hypothetical protein
MNPYALTPGTRVRCRVRITCTPTWSIRPGDLGTVLRRRARLPWAEAAWAVGREVDVWNYDVRWDTDVLMRYPWDALFMRQDDVERVD